MNVQTQANLITLAVTVLFFALFWVIYISTLRSAARRRSDAAPASEAEMAQNSAVYSDLKSWPPPPVRAPASNNEKR